MKNRDTRPHGSAHTALALDVPAPSRAHGAQFAKQAQRVQALQANIRGSHATSSKAQQAPLSDSTNTSRVDSYRQRLEPSETHSQRTSARKRKARTHGAAETNRASREKKRAPSRLANPTRVPKVRERTRWNYASSIVAFERPRPYPAFHIFIRQEDSWQEWQLSSEPERANGVRKLVGQWPFVPYRQEIKRISLHELPWEVKQALKKIKLTTSIATSKELKRQSR